MTGRMMRGVPRLPAVAMASVLAVSALPIGAFAAAGDLDPTFGQGGRAVIDFGGAEIAYALALQPDGKVVVAGSAGVDAGVFRLTADGALDTSFDGDGRVAIDSGGLEAAHALALQPDGKVVVAGFTNVAGTQDVVVYRLNPNGSLDPSFDGDGRLGIDSGGDEFAEDLAVQSDGKMLIAGRTSIGSDVALYRLNADGSFDPSFDGDGRLGIDLGGGETATSVVVQADGKILVAGRTSVNSSGIVLRLNPDGSSDTSFAGGGVFAIDLGGSESFSAVRLQPDGKIVVAGTSRAVPGPASNAIVLRLNANGSPDSTFDGDGRVIVDAGGGDATALALQADGRVLVAGYGRDLPAVESYISVARLNVDGSLDTGFGDDGRVAIVAADWEIAYAIAVQQDGRAVVAGYGPAGTSYDAVAYRLQADPTTPAPLEHAREVSLSVGRRARGIVSVADGFSECAANVPVKVQHREDGQWRRVGRTTTDDAGAFVVRGTRDPGKYRAVARRVTLDSGDVCLADRSPVVRS